LEITAAREQRFITFGLLQRWVVAIVHTENAKPFVLFQPGGQRDMKNEPISSNSQTDWERLDAMTDADIDLSNCPELTPELFAKAVVRRGLKPVPRKAQVTLRLDQDVLD
jgi:uncharacterized protein (DUF4415 family)